MLRTLWTERRILIAIAALWLAIVSIVWGLAYLTVTKAHGAPKAKKPEAPAAAPVEPAQKCVPIAPLMERLKASGFEYETVTNPSAVLRISLAILAGADKPFKMPDKLVIVFVGVEAKIGLIIKEEVCAVVTGPASGVRALLQRVHGQSVSGV